MATPFFGKRENETSTTARPGSANAYASTGVSSTVTSAAQTTSAVKPAGEASTTAGTSKEGGSKLTVGPNIKLKGVEITDCDTLVVEGYVEATMDSRVIQIAEQGAFRGAAEIDIAEIRGEFSGTLTARHKLVIHGTGKVSGKVRYGKLVIEEGGQLSGEVEMGTGAALARARPEPASALAA